MAQEITFNYQLDTLGKTKVVCKCGAANCSGFLGAKVKAAELVEVKPPKQKKRKKCKPAPKEKFTEDNCFRCCDGGSLIMCDFKDCPKVWCLPCIGEEKAPRGTCYTTCLSYTSLMLPPPLTTCPSYIFWTRSCAWRVRLVTRRTMSAYPARRPQNACLAASTL